jgi:hypothetical protein
MGRSEAPFNAREETAAARWRHSIASRVPGSSAAGLDSDRRHDTHLQWPQ